MTNIKYELLIFFKKKEKEAKPESIGYDQGQITDPI